MLKQNIPPKLNQNEFQELNVKIKSRKKELKAHLSYWNQY